MLEIRMQGVYSLLQLAIVFTCQLLPNKVVTRPDVRHPRPPAERVVLSDVLGGKDVVEGRDGRTDGRIG
jgi:hypothetical protein